MGLIYKLKQIHILLSYNPQFSPWIESVTGQILAAYAVVSTSYEFL